MVKALTVAGVIVVLMLMLCVTSCQTVPAGHVAVATYFGEVQGNVYEEGMHFPVNPLYLWTQYDARQKTHKETVSVPSRDQLSTRMDLSVQYRLNAEMATRMKQETGGIEEVISVHLVPKLRSLAREQGKGVQRAEDFFIEDIQQQLQDDLTSRLRTFCEPKGLKIEAVLIRDISLPGFIVKAIESKKEREQVAERQKAELERFKTEQEQKIAQADAEKKAAELTAEKVRTLADAQAYEINKINEAIADSPGYVQLQALDALKSMSKDPAAKLYFMDGGASNPLPLMHMGEGLVSNK